MWFINLHVVELLIQPTQDMLVRRLQKKKNTQLYDSFCTHVSHTKNYMTYNIHPMTL